MPPLFPSGLSIKRWFALSLSYLSGLKPLQRVRRSMVLMPPFTIPNFFTAKIPNSEQDGVKEHILWSCEETKVL